MTGRELRCWVRGITIWCCSLWDRARWGMVRRVISRLARFIGRFVGLRFPKAAFFDAEARRRGEDLTIAELASPRGGLFIAEARRRGARRRVWRGAMRIGVGLLLIPGLFGAVGNVAVRGGTSTQAILDYTAPGASDRMVGVR